MLGGVRQVGWGLSLVGGAVVSFSFGACGFRCGGGAVSVAGLYAVTCYNAPPLRPRPRRPSASVRRRGGRVAAGRPRRHCGSLMFTFLHILFSLYFFPKTYVCFGIAHARDAKKLEGFQYIQA